MWNKHKYAVLSFLLIVGIFLTGVRLPYFAEAAGVDKTALISPNVVKTITQDGVAIPGTGIRIDKPVTMELRFNLPVKGDSGNNYVNKGDFATISLGKGVKFESGIIPPIVKEIKVRIDGSDISIGHVTFKVNPSDSEEMIAEFLFDGDDDVYNGNKRAVKINAGVDFAVETKNINPNQITNKTITVLGKEYKIDPKLDDKVTIEKSHEVEAYNIVWKLTVSRSAIGINKKLDLKGFKIEDDLSGVDIAKYNTESVEQSIKKSFYVNGKKREPEYSESTKKLTYTFVEGDTNSDGNAIITFKTYMEYSYTKIHGGSGKEYKNTASVLDSSKNKKDIATDSFNWPGFGEKRARKQPDGRYYRIVSNSYYIDWDVDFNENEDALKNVKLTDELKSDRFGNAHLEFVSAEAIKWENATLSSIKFKTFIQRPENDIYDIGDINTKMRFSITTKVIYNTGVTPGTFCKFSNYIKATWNDSPKGVGMSNSVDIGEKPLKKGVKQLTIDASDPESSTYKDKDITAFETEWKVTVEKKNGAPGYYSNAYVYDLMIFDKDVYIPGLKNGDVTYQEENNNTPATPATGDIEQYRGDSSRHQKYVPNSASMTTSGLVYKIYKVMKQGVHIGDLLEVKDLQNNTRNEFSLKTIVTEPDELVKMTGRSNLYNYVTLFKNGKKIDDKESWPTFNNKVLKKQTLRAQDAKALLTSTNFAVNLANEHVYEPTTFKYIDNDTEAYDKENHSILYRISVNGSPMHDVGDFELRDTAPEGWEFDKIEGDNKFLIYEGKSFSQVYKPDATLEAVNKINFPSNNINADVTSKSAVITFKDIAKPYVVFLKIKMKDTRAYLNKKEIVDNIAVVSLAGVTANDRQKVTVDEQFLTKEVNENDLDKGYVTWTINYKPYGFLTNGSVALEDVLGEGLEIRRSNDDSKGLLFSGNNFKATRNHIPITGNELKNLFKYNETDRKLTFELDDKTASYEISYITDIVDKNIHEKLNNTVTVKEGTETINMEPKKAIYRVANAYANATLKGFQRLKIIKTNKEGNLKLQGAEFTLMKKLDRSVVTKVTTNVDGVAYLRKLIDGEYILKETKAPDGYAIDNTEHEVKIEEKPDGDKYKMEVIWKGDVLNNNNEITIKNEKAPSTPSNPGGGGGVTPPPTTPEIPVTPTNPPKPAEPTKPNDPEKPNDPGKPNKPTKPTTPEEPEDPDPDDPDTPDEPDTPDPTPTIPSYPINNTPDPNDPNSPDEITVIGDDGTPLGRFIKKKKPNGEFEYVSVDDGTPLGSIKVPTLPKTGGTSSTWYYAVGAGLVLGAGFMLKKRDEEEQES